MTAQGQEKARARKQRYNERLHAERYGPGAGDQRGRHGNHRHGSTHHRWNQSRTSTTGYILIRVGRSHALADPNGYAYEHLVVWMSNGGSRPAEGCVLHHINGDKQDNRIENLRVEARGDHNKHHNAERGRNKDGTFRARTGKKAAGCLLDGREHKEWPQ